jgi:hypothetical protein
MPVRTTVEIPEPLHDILRRQAERSGASIRSLIVRAIEQTYQQPHQRPKKGKRVTGPMIKRRGKLGPAYPADENPHDLVFS